MCVDLLRLIKDNASLCIRFIRIRTIGTAWPHAFLLIVPIMWRTLLRIFIGKFMGLRLVEFFNFFICWAL